MIFNMPNNDSVDLSAAEIAKFRKLLKIFGQIHKEDARTDIDLFINMCDNSLYDMYEFLTKEH